MTRRIWTAFTGIAALLIATTDASAARAGNGQLEIDVSNIVGQSLDTRIVLSAVDSKSSKTFELPRGVGTLTLDAARYTAYVYCRHEGIPYLVHVKDVEIKSGQTEYLLVSLLEGASGKRGLDKFDRDLDLALDRVEIETGFDPDDSASVPGMMTFTWNSPVLSTEAGWYRGDLHVQSGHGKGKESVRALIRRAEKKGLDFLAIADRNTLAAPLDPAFQSNSTVLIPAMEWGADDRGVALIYAPKTMPKVPDSMREAQAACILVQAQGGVFAVAHPCFPIGPWQWGLSYVNAIQVWARPWREIPPVSLDLLGDMYQERKDGRLVHSVALAAATSGKSANGQSSMFWDLELKRGLKAAAIGGSRSASTKVPMGEPLTYIYAREKSLAGIMEGLRAGRTMLARDENSPWIEFTADIGGDGTFDRMVGDIVPLREEIRFRTIVEGGLGRRLEILLNGYPIRSMKIESDPLIYEFVSTAQNYEVYRVRVTELPTSPGFGAFDMLAMTSPIYAQEVVIYDPEKGEYGWIELENDYVDTSNLGSHLPQNPEQSEIDAKPIFKE